MKRTHWSSIILMWLIAVIVIGSLPTKMAHADDTLRRYPVIPVIRGGVASQVRALVRLGNRKGNRLAVFSKMGDSITHFTYFLTPIGTGGLQLGAYSNLQDTVNFFMTEVARTNNSFANESLAAMSGWTSTDMLNPAKALGGCEVDETPVACELRVTKPAVALIMIGTNDLPLGDVKTFRANLTAIVKLCKQAGVVPVLSTIPYRRDPEYAMNFADDFNRAIVQVATQQAVPLWNYWLAVDALPDNGLSTDKVHPSVPPDQNTAVFDEQHLQFGFTMRNLTALQVLDALRPYLR